MIEIEIMMNQDSNTREQVRNMYKICEFICVILGLLMISVGMFVNVFYRNYYTLMLFCILANLYVFMCIYIKSHKNCEKCDLLYCTCKESNPRVSRVFCWKLKPRYTQQIDELPV